MIDLLWAVLYLGIILAVVGITLISTGAHKHYDKFWEDEE